DVDPLRPPIEGGEVVRKRFEAPVDAEGEGLGGHALDVLQGPNHCISVFRAGRRHTEAAVAHDHTGHTVPTGRGEVRIPQDLGVVVGVYVDESRSECEPTEVDHLGVGGRLETARTTNGLDAISDYGDVGGAGRAAGAVDQ